MREHAGLRSQTIEVGPDLEKNSSSIKTKLNNMRVSKEWSNNMPIHRSPYKFEIGQYTYHVSIIDYLQVWNLEKKAENYLKTNKQLSAFQQTMTADERARKEISAVEPIRYSERFEKFMEKNVFKQAKDF